MRERNHGAGDHPIPFRTRQLSPASPMVLRRQAAGEQDVPLTQGARAPREQKTRSKDRLRGGLFAYGGIFLADAREQRGALGRVKGEEEVAACSDGKGCQRGAQRGLRMQALEVLEALARLSGS